MSSTKTENDSHFKIHVARAKDLPLSWYELVLRPEKFKEHLQLLRANPHSEPTALQLIVTFLEKAGCFNEEQSSPPENGSISQKKKKTLIECALLLASFLHWDLPLFEKRLPDAVQFVLTAQLSNAYPLKGGPLCDEEQSTLIAHVISNIWIIRYTAQHHYQTLQLHTTTSSLFDITSASADQFKFEVTPLVESAVEFLRNVCKLESLAENMESPMVCVSLPLPGKSEGSVMCLELEEEGWIMSRDDLLCQIQYSLGCYYFMVDDLSSAYSAFSQCKQLLSGTPPPLVNPADLRGYLLACESMRVEEVREDMTIEEKLERMKITDPEKVVDILIDDLMLREIPYTFRSSLEKDMAASQANTELTNGAPAPKKQKLDSDFQSTIPLMDRVCLCNGIYCILEGKPPSTRLWELVQCSSDNRCLNFIFCVCSKGFNKKLKALDTLRLKYFLMSLCSGSKISLDAWNTLLQSPLQQLFSSEEQQRFKDLLKPHPSITSLTSSRTREEANGDDGGDDDDRSIRRLECRVGQALSSGETLAAVEDLFKAVPESQHKSLAMKWVGSTRGFAPAESVANAVVLTKYNALIHRARVLKQAESYTECHEVMECALKLLMSKKIPISSRVRQQLEECLHEELFTVELIKTHKELFSSNHLNKRLQSRELAPLVAKSKAYYMSNRPLLDAVVMHIAGAFLLNTQQYSFFLTNDKQHEPGKVAPSLAAAILSVKEGKEQRKSMRDLFEAVLSVFLPQLLSNEGKAEKLTKLRMNLAMFVENLLDEMCLSLLLAALARIWNILKKPEDEILSEFNHHWPTAIGNPASIDVSHVFRALNVTLSHALKLRPNMTPWITMKGDVHCAIGNYGTALECYLHAGAISSQFFEADVSISTWTQTVYRRIIKCCTKLGYNTHAAVFCQFLQPVDYELAFEILNSSISTTVESLFAHFWDMTIIEYLIYIHSKRGDSHKQSAAIQVAGQPELNFNNSSEMLARATQVRRRRFLRTFCGQVAHYV